MTKRVKDEELEKVSGGMDRLDLSDPKRPPGGSGSNPPELIDPNDPGTGGGPITNQIDVQNDNETIGGEEDPGHVAPR